jgi:hypothetical protein
MSGGRALALAMASHPDFPAALFMGGVALDAGRNVINARSNGRSAARAWDARMMSVADSLFNEYDDMPVIDVVRALVAARRELHSAGVVPAPPELIGARARGMLLLAS